MTLTTAASTLALLVVPLLIACGGVASDSQHGTGDGAVTDGPSTEDAGICPADTSTATCSPDGAVCHGSTGCVPCGPGLWDIETPGCFCSGGKWSCAEPGACIAGPGTYRDSSCKQPAVPDGGTEAGPSEAGACEAAPAPDGSTDCAGFSPGVCAGTPCSQPGLQCYYAPTYLTGTCCGGTWSCVGI